MIRLPNYNELEEYSLAPPSYNKKDKKENYSQPMKLKQVKHGVESYSNLINSNLDVLLMFLEVNSRKPVFYIDVQGYKMVDDLVVTDFSFTIDASSTLMDFGTLKTPPMQLLDNKKLNNLNMNLEETLKNYLECKKSLKQLNLRSRVLINTSEFQTSIEHLIKSSGYEGEVKVNFRQSPFKLKVKSNSKRSKFANKNVVKTLNLITGAFLVTKPFKSKLKTNFELISEYMMDVDAACWVYEHKDDIVNAMYNK